MRGLQDLPEASKRARWPDWAWSHPTLLVVNLQFRLRSYKRAHRASATSSGHAVWQLPPIGCQCRYCQGGLIRSHMAKDCRYSQSKTLFGVQGFPPTHPPTHPVHSALTGFTAGIITHQAAQSDWTGDSWVFHSLLNSQWLFLSQLLVLWSASGVCTGDLQIWPPQADHICQLRVQKNNPTITTVFSVFVSSGRAGLTLWGASHI